MTNNSLFDTSAVTSAFKAYDVRGKIPTELNENIVKYIGNAFIQVLETFSKPIVIGYDVRPTSKAFSLALIQGITEAGVDVIDIGLVGTDMVYYATAAHQAGGGVMITASHNPADYNGLKFVRAGAVPLSQDTGLLDILDLVVRKNYQIESKLGTVKEIDILDEYIKHLLQFVDVSKIPSLKVVMNAGNGCAGTVLPQLLKNIPQINAVPLFWEPDGLFPNGIPNPLLPERRVDTTQKVRETQANLGVAWDGDFDRCFFYDDTGEFIEGYYLVALFGEHFAKLNPGAKIIHDPRLIWATQDAVLAVQGNPIEHRAGHTFVKERMRQEDAIYAGEMSAHHYFRDNYYADNGMIPMLLLLEILGTQPEKSLKKLVERWMALYPVSGEINITVNNPNKIINMMEEKFKHKAINVRHVDGLSIDFNEWRFNLRKSNTEPVIRLNVETRGSTKLMEQKTDELLALIREFDKVNFS